MSNYAPNDLRDYAGAGDGEVANSESETMPDVDVNTVPPKRTYRKSRKKRKKVVRWWRSCPDAFAEVWEDVTAWLDETPYLASNLVLKRLQAMYPDQYPDNKLRTLQRRVKAWRLSQIEKSEHEFSTGDSLPDADTIELVVHCESHTGNESL